MPSPDENRRQRAMTADQYLEQLQALLPPGAAWPRQPHAVLTELLAAFAEEHARIDQRGEQLLDEADPRSTFELLADWERVTGLPDPCVGGDPSVAQRRASLLQKVTSLGGASRDYFIAVAAALGFVVTVSEFRAQDVNDDVDYPIYGVEWNFAWQVNAPLNTVGEFDVEGTANDALAWWGNEQLECVLRPLRPAHTQVLFAYS